MSVDYGNNNVITSGVIVASSGDFVNLSINGLSFSNSIDGNIIISPNSTERVGLGTNAPSEKLEVAGNVKADNIIHPFLLGGM